MPKKQRTAITKQQAIDQALGLFGDNLRCSMKKYFGISVRVVCDGGWLRQNKQRKGVKNG